MFHVAEDDRMKLPEFGWADIFKEDKGDRCLASSAFPFLSVSLDSLHLKNHFALKYQMIT